MQPNTIISPDGATVVLPSRELLLRMLNPKAPTRNKDMKPVVQARVRELEAA
ncbi:hypothetical protein [Acetobacter indonesiensis]|uniref:hypothetical protein n=1 Tax=Acetobacter indonesiensis TaxID=104101 RepID=UPI0039EA2AD6